MVTKVFGIDFGSIYSYISYVDEAGRTVVLKNVGYERKEPFRIYFASEDAVANILRKIVSDAEFCLDEKVEQVVIACPSYYGLREKEVLYRAAKTVGLNVVALIPEPIAAAISYVCYEEKCMERTILMYDLGGGTFDVTLLHLSKDNKIDIIVCDGDIYLGGVDWNQILIEHMAEKIAKQVGCAVDDVFNDAKVCAILQNESERIKKNISNNSGNAEAILDISGEKIRYEITLKQFEEMSSELCERTIILTKELLEKGKARGYDHFDSIFLAGGAACMKQIERTIVKEFGIKPQLFEPDEAVAKGAAIYGTASMPPDFREDFGCEVL